MSSLSICKAESLHMGGPDPRSGSQRTTAVSEIPRNHRQLGKQSVQIPGDHVAWQKQLLKRSAQVWNPLRSVLCGHTMELYGTSCGLSARWRANYSTPCNAGIRHLQQTRDAHTCAKRSQPSHSSDGSTVAPVPPAAAVAQKFAAIAAAMFVLVRLASTAGTGAQQMPSRACKVLAQPQYASVFRPWPLSVVLSREAAQLPGLHLMLCQILCRHCRLLSGKQSRHAPALTVFSPNCCIAHKHGPPPNTLNVSPAPSLQLLGSPPRHPSSTRSCSMDLFASDSLSSNTLELHSPPHWCHLSSDEGRGP